MGINILIENPGQSDIFVDCETPTEALEMLRGLGLAPLRRTVASPFLGTQEGRGTVLRRLMESSVPVEQVTKAPRTRATTRTAAVASAAPTSNTGTAPAVRAALAKFGPLANTDIAEHTGIDRPKITNIMPYMRRTGQVKKLADGRWQLRGRAT